MTKKYNTWKMLTDLWHDETYPVLSKQIKKNKKNTVTRIWSIAFIYKPLMIRTHLLSLCFLLCLRDEKQNMKCACLSSYLVFNDHTSMTVECFCDLPPQLCRSRILFQSGEKWLTCPSTSAQGQGSTLYIFLVDDLIDLISRL